MDVSQMPLATTGSLLDSFIASVAKINPCDDYEFEDFIESLLPELMEAAANAQLENRKYGKLVCNEQRYSSAMHFLSNFQGRSCSHVENAEEATH
jgi:hypothetical protein